MSNNSSKKPGNITLKQLKRKNMILKRVLKKVVDGIDEQLLLDELLFDSWDDLFALVQLGRRTLKNIDKKLGNSELEKEWYDLGHSLQERLPYE